VVSVPMADKSRNHPIPHVCCVTSVPDTSGDGALTLMVLGERSVMAATRGVGAWVGGRVGRSDGIALGYCQAKAGSLDESKT
jgi:hypothetical protein